MDISRINQQKDNYQIRKNSKKKEENPSATINTKDTVEKSSDQGEPNKLKKWTIMHYSAADNNLTYYLIKDVNEMEKVGSTNNMNIIVQLDKGNDNCKRFQIEKDDDDEKITSPVLERLGRTNMSDPNVLADFVISTKKKYPAEHYALIISDHGSAWEGAIEDESHNGWMSTPQIKKALDKAEDATGQKLDLLGFDACLMASTEVAYELKDNASYMVASEESEGVDGWPYTPLLTKKTLNEVNRAIDSKLDISPRDLAVKIVEETDGVSKLPTMSAVDLSQMKELSKEINTFAENILKTDTPNNILKNNAKRTTSFGNYKDHYHFAELVSKDNDIKDEELKKSAKGVMKAIKKAVIKEQHSSKYPDAHGLNAEIPVKAKVGRGYTQLQFAKDTKWDEAMNKLNSDKD